VRASECNTSEVAATPRPRHPGRTMGVDVPIPPPSLRHLSCAWPARRPHRGTMSCLLRHSSVRDAHDVHLSPDADLYERFHRPRRRPSVMGVGTLSAVAQQRGYHGLPWVSVGAIDDPRPAVVRSPLALGRDVVPVLRVSGRELIWPPVVAWECTRRRSEAYIVHSHISLVVERECGPVRHVTPVPFGLVTDAQEPREG
jgi:hypothetical protein